MKPRIIDPSFWEDLDVIQLTRDERLLLVAMITAGADDYGRIKANASYLKRLAFAFDADISIADVEAMILHIIECCKNLVGYRVKTERYACFTNWQRYQRIKYQRQSVLPAPPNYVDAPQEDEISENLPCSDNVGQDAPKLDDVSKNCIQGRVVLDSVGLSCEGKGGDGLEQPAASAFFAQARKQFENSIGPFSPLLADQVGDMLGELESKGLQDWWALALRQAEAQNKRKWAYVRAILDSCLKEGKPPGDRARASPKPQFTRNKNGTIIMPSGGYSERAAD